MKLITEMIDDSKMVIEEGKDGKKDIFIEGTYMQSDVKNHNGRMYPKKIMEAQLKEYHDSYIDKNRAMGELGHPNSPSINLDRVSHNIVMLEYKNSTDVYGKAKLLDTPCGNIAKNLVKEGIVLGVSSRGLGSVKESNGVNVVQSNFKLATIDIVADPSAPSAFVNGIMENREWIFVDGILVEKEIEDLQKEINTLARTGKLNDSAMNNLFQKIATNI